MMLIKRKSFIILAWVVLIPFMNCYPQEQRFGLPGIRNFKRSEYNGGTQNWAVSQAENGKMYFGNNDGLLEYDGAHWKVYKDLELLNRALYIDGKRIYVGANNKIGYYEENAEGRLLFHSLNPLLKNRIPDFEDIWRIYKTSFGIVFQSFKAIFIYNPDKIDIVYPRSQFHLSYYVNGVLWVNDEVQGLMQFRDGKVRQIPGGGIFSRTEIWTILPLNDDQMVIGTAKKGLYKYDGEKITPWDKPVNALLKKYQIFSGAVVDSRYFAFGTIQNGLIVSDTAGRVMFEINKERGLLNNTVLSVSTDRQGDIWLGLDNGISVVNFDSPVTYIQNYYDIGSGYTSARFNGNLYLGTNQGLFYIKWSDFTNPLKKKEDFHLIDGTEGQVWGLSVIDGTLLCGHNFGVFQINGDKAVKISSIPGGWSFLKLNQKQPFILVGHYSGLSIFERKENLWSYRNELQGFGQSSHYFEQDSLGDIWVSHDYKGIYRLHPDSSMRKVSHITFYDTLQGLPAQMNNRIFRLQSGLLVATINGIYRFNERTRKFMKDAYFNNFLRGYTKIDYLTQDNPGNVWYYHERQPGVLQRQKNGGFKNIEAPFYELGGQIIPAFGHIDVLDENNVLIGIEGGYAHYSTSYKKQHNPALILYISSLRSSDTTQGVYRYDNTVEKQLMVPAFNYINNTVSIAFASNNFETRETYFQCKLLNFDDKWSDWSTQKFKEYTNLHEGHYTFMLQARNGSQTPYSTLSFRFTIRPPWYRSMVAMIVYIILFLVIILLVQVFVRRSMTRLRQKEKEKQKLKYSEREQKLKEDALIAEKEMIKLRNEKLNLEMIHKEKELANSTMLLIRKNNILNKLKTDLKGMMSSPGEDAPMVNISSLIKRIDKDMDNEKQWQVFNIYVEQVYEELLHKLKESYPDLTPRELKLCAFLKMNISSKEIASLMNISPRGVEISRYRIRKKLKLDREANLTEFMINL